MCLFFTRDVEWSCSRPFPFIYDGVFCLCLTVSDAYDNETHGLAFLDTWRFCHTMYTYCSSVWTDVLHFSVTFAFSRGHGSLWLQDFRGLSAINTRFVSGTSQKKLYKPLLFANSDILTYGPLCSLFLGGGAQILQISNVPWKNTHETCACSSKSFQ